MPDRSYLRLPVSGKVVGQSRRALKGELARRPDIDEVAGCVTVCFERPMCEQVRRQEVQGLRDAERKRNQVHRLWQTQPSRHIGSKLLAGHALVSDQDVAGYPRPA